MSDDIVARLRAVEDWYCKREGPGISLEGEAADQITRLRAELAAAQWGLQQCMGRLEADPDDFASVMDALTETAAERDALRELLREASDWITPSSEADEFCARIDAVLKGGGDE